MRLIAHRGNLYGPSPLENQPNYILRAYEKGFDVEVDVWWVNGGFFLGHDGPKYPVKQSFLEMDIEDPLGYWCHAKNEDAFKALLDIDSNCFWHDSDTYTVTMSRKVWCYPNAPLVPDAVWNQPEWESIDDLYTVKPEEMDKWYGVCSDYCELLKTIYDGKLTATGYTDV